MKIYEVIGRTPEYRLKKHQMRLDRPAWRDQQQRRYSREEELSDRQRHVPKSQIGYHPYAIPLIRFGRFGTRSKIGLDSGMKHEFGNMTHEAGVSVYRGIPHKNGWMAVEPDNSRARYNVIDPFAPLDQFGAQLLDYLDHGTPMDIYLIHGHLAAFGKNGKEYLEIGSDGEYLLDAAQPYRMERLFPEFTYMNSDLNFIQYMNAKYARRGYGRPNDAPAAGIAQLRQQVADDQDELA